MKTGFERMAEAQGRIISDLRESLRSTVARLDEAEDRLRTAEQRAAYYKMIEDACREYPAVASEWVRFCSILRLALPEDQQPPPASRSPALMEQSWQ